MIRKRAPCGVLSSPQDSEKVDLCVPNSYQITSERELFKFCTLELGPIVILKVVQATHYIIIKSVPVEGFYHQHIVCHPEPRSWGV